MKKSINHALLLKKYIYPTDLPCCNRNPKDLKFFHKNDCKGELYEGKLNGKVIIVCSKCRAFNFYERFIWTCPNCWKKFNHIKVHGECYLKKENIL